MLHDRLEILFPDLLSYFFRHLQSLLGIAGVGCRLAVYHILDYPGMMLVVLIPLELEFDFFEVEKAACHPPRHFLNEEEILFVEFVTLAAEILHRDVGGVEAGEELEELLPRGDLVLLEELGEFELHFLFVFEEVVDSTPEHVGVVSKSFQVGRVEVLEGVHA